MRPALPDYVPDDDEIDYVPLPKPSHLKAGDWLVVVSWPNAKQVMFVDPAGTEERFHIAVRDPVPLRTVICYYSGTTPVAHRWQDFRRDVTVYRVTADHDPVPVPDWPRPASR